MAAFHLTLAATHLTCARLRLECQTDVSATCLTARYPSLLPHPLSLLLSPSPSLVAYHPYLAFPTAW